MGPRSIVVAEDETFHPAIRLVAMDAESGLILVEKYSESRDAATGGQALDEVLDGLPVSVTQVVGDEAKGSLLMRGTAWASRTPRICSTFSMTCPRPPA